VGEVPAVHSRAPYHLSEVLGAAMSDRPRPVVGAWQALTLFCCTYRTRDRRRRPGPAAHRSVSWRRPAAGPIFEVKDRRWSGVGKNVARVA
jgi:hypothetical protein